MIRITVPIPQGTTVLKPWERDANHRTMSWTAFKKQEEALSSAAFEVLFGGARGGGKTGAGMAWLILGGGEGLAKYSYINHPGYRALVLRKNVVDMTDWINKARVMYGPLGGEYKVGDNEFRFPSGATIIIGHLDDSESFEKYQGQEFVKILLEEATQIPSEILYLRVMSSCRTPFKEMRCQIWLTANPGGPGSVWVSDRFVAHGDGKMYTDPETGLTRIFVAARVYDNPVYATDKQYIGQLMSLPPAIRRAWLDGDWTALQGAAFEEFRLAPASGEPPEACHIVQSTDVKLAPWFHRWIACDWGYTHNAAVYKLCELPNKQVHVYDELVLSKVTPEELGVEIARFMWDEIRGTGTTPQAMILHLSPDAFAHRTEERTIADQIRDGLNKILGPDSAYIPSLEEVGEKDIFARSAQAKAAVITIQRASNQRVAGWMYLRSLLRWTPLIGEANDRFDPTVALELYNNDFKKFQEYLRLFQTQDEVLPRLKIHADKCPKLLRAIPLARFQDPDKGDPNDLSKKHFEGMDSLDAWRYGCFAQKFIQTHAPFETFLSDRFAKAGHLQDGNSKVQIARKAEADYKKLNTTMTKPFNFDRSATLARRHRKTPPNGVSRPA